MRSFTNLITVVFVVGVLFFAYKSPTVQNIVKNYATQAESEMQDLAGGRKISFNLKSITDSFAKLMDTGSLMGTGTTEIEQVVTPGPLTKIPTPQSTPSTPTKPAAPSTPTQTPSQDSKLKLTVKGIILATNVQRTANAHGTVAESAKLDASALAKANDILSGQYFEHMSPSGKSVSDLVSAQGYTYVKIGENLALGDFSNDADVVTAWMNSPGHRANILDGQFTEIGVGVAYGMYKGHMSYVAVQHFGKPTSACPSIDQSLKADVEKGQAQLTADSNSLQAQSIVIEQGNKEGKDMRVEIDVYNAGVEKYQRDFAKNDALRVQYNAQVTAFNKCINSAS